MILHVEFVERLSQFLGNIRACKKARTSRGLTEETPMRHWLKLYDFWGKAEKIVRVVTLTAARTTAGRSALCAG
jgi:hypothetical protein